MFKRFVIKGSGTEHIKLGLNDKRGSSGQYILKSKFNSCAWLLLQFADK